MPSWFLNCPRLGLIVHFTSPKEPRVREAGAVFVGANKSDEAVSYAKKLTESGNMYYGWSVSYEETDVFGGES
jgi:hypothetical protein